MEGSGGRERRGLMKSVNSRARKVASPPLGKRTVATHVGNKRTRSASSVRSLPVRQSAGPQVRRSAFYPYPRFLVCYSPPKTVPETVKKPFLAIFWGFNLISTRLLPKICYSKKIVQNSAQFLTIFDFDREYLRNGSTYLKSEKFFIVYKLSHVGRKKLVYFGPQI